MFSRSFADAIRRNGNIWKFNEIGCEYDLITDVFESYDYHQQYHHDFLHYDSPRFFRHREVQQQREDDKDDYDYDGDYDGRSFVVDEVDEILNLLVDELEGAGDKQSLFELTDFTVSDHRHYTTPCHPDLSYDFCSDPYFFT